MPASMRVILLTAGLLLLAATAEASVLCARRRSDGTVSGGVKVRAACRPTEVTLTPDAVGFCCTATTTSTTTSVTTPACPTTTTLGIPTCGPGSCGFPCLSGQACIDPGNGQCTCSGPVFCGGTFFTCGGECPVGQTCTGLPVPAGCPSVGCTCQ
jgi:hypothetical protein